MKTKKWINGNKMLFESEHKTFNRQCKYISTGNQIGDTVLSSYVRPFSEVKCNGITNAKGHLQEYDLNWILSDLPSGVKNWIREHAKTKGVIAYHFFYMNRKKERVNIGYVVTDKNYKLLTQWHTRGLKAYSALNECIKYITN